MSDPSLPTPVGGMPTRVGKYKILRQIAQGGMAEIYLATAEGIERFEKLVVLKRILPILAGNREFVEMFLDEARIAGSLLHSNIAQVFDIGSDAGSYYFVMEFLRGEDVRHLLMKSVERREPIPYEHIVTIITGVCSGLHYAHEMRGRDGQQLHIVHRDISPQNVFVTHDGNVKLCDFGIAKSATQLTETRVGTLKGKIRYMSPEQCQAEPLDRRSDIFALSIVLWELITQRRLFRGKSDFEVFKAICEDDAPRPSDFRGDVAPGLEAIVMKGLAREREQRFQTAQELQIALEDWARGDRVPASPVRLASYMKDLFGVPPLPTENILEQMTEADPLAKRIKQLNYQEESGKSGVSKVRPSQDLTAAALEHAEQEQHEPSSQQYDLGDLDVEAPARKRTPWTAIAILAVLLIGGTTLGLSLRHAPPLPLDTSTAAPVVPPTPTPPASATPSAAETPKPTAAEPTTIDTKPVETKPDPKPADATQALTPGVAQGPARVEKPAARPIIRSKTTTQRPRTKPAPVKKGPALDELLPP